MPAEAPDLDVLIFGGGVAGLWTLARLRRLGFSCLLLESVALGAGQTIASQGIIHGGVKYALSGVPSKAAKFIAEMPKVWDDCLAGRGEIDLSACRTLSDGQYLWTTPGLVSRIAGFGASRLIRAEVERLPAAERPEAFAHFPKGVDVYRVPERVIDPRSLIAALAAPANSGGRAALASGGSPTITPGNSSRLWTVRCAGSGVTLQARALVFAAGEGNAALMDAAGMRGGGLHQQVRPLHMVMMRPAPFDLFGHCIGASNVPRLTITTGLDRRSGGRVWYIGGGIAEGSAFERGTAEQIEACRRELRECLGNIDTGGFRFAAFRINRAEGASSNARGVLQRPDEPRLTREGSAIVGWPTKLAFAPAFAGRVVELLGEAGVVPSGAVDGFKMHPLLGPVEPAQPPWETSQWT